MVELRNVSVRYSNGVDALKNVSLTINQGEFAFVVGESGAGKSTLIKLLIREIAPSSGKVFVGGMDVGRLKRDKIWKLRQKIGYVFQDFKLIDSLNVFDNVAFVPRCTDKSNKYMRNRVPYVLQLVGLKDKIKCMPRELSGGEQQRVALARALVCDPALIIADEPTGNLDPKTSMEIIELLQAVNECGTTVMMVTHEHEFVRAFGGRTISLSDGEKLFDEIIK
ncbi:MAG: cell division ATP-binding protein FtsE [Ruminococcus sp.]|jgi:cell division transport system ATP-binding protein|nr:cell division ATP-binding protein FtsE [Ruminococcus sp.]